MGRGIEGEVGFLIEDVFLMYFFYNLFKKLIYFVVLEINFFLMIIEISLYSFCKNKKCF